MSDRGQCSPAGTDFGLREIPWGTGRLLNSEGSGKGKRNVILNRLGHIFKQSDAVWHFLALLPLAFPHGLRDFTAFVRNFTATAENCSRSNRVVLRLDGWPTSVRGVSPRIRQDLSRR